MRRCQVLFPRQHLVAFTFCRIDNAPVHEHPLPALLAYLERVVPRLPPAHTVNLARPPSGGAQPAGSGLLQQREGYVHREIGAPV